MASSAEGIVSNTAEVSPSLLYFVALSAFAPTVRLPKVEKNSSISFCSIWFLFSASSRALSEFLSFISSIVYLFLSWSSSPSSWDIRFLRSALPSSSLKSQEERHRFRLWLAGFAEQARFLAKPGLPAGLMGGAGQAPWEGKEACGLRLALGQAPQTSLAPHKTLLLPHEPPGTCPQPGASLSPQWNSETLQTSGLVSHPPEGGLHWHRAGQGPSQRRE